MTLIHKGWAGLLIGLAIGLMLSLSPRASAQGGEAVRCESQDGHFNRCRIPWRDAALQKQESHGACIRGQSWGVDRDGLWVDHGCRGVFMAAGRDWRDRDDRGGYDGHRDGYGDRDAYRDHDAYRDRDDRDDDHYREWRPGPDWDRAIRLRCDSNGRHYQLCQVDVGRRGDVRLEQQISDSSCREGYSWGWNRAGVWVSHGCRAQFVVHRRW